MPADRQPAPANTYWRGETLWGRLKIAGVQHRTSLRTSDPREARKRVRDWRKKLEADRFKPAEEDRHRYVAAVVQWTEDELPRQVKPSVVERYTVSIRAMDPFFRDLYLDQIDQKAIIAFLQARSRTVSNTTMRRDLTALSRLMAAARNWGWIDRNPVVDIERKAYRERRDPIVLPTPQDYARVLAAAPPVMRRILDLLHTTGMRENEAVELRRQAVQWERGAIMLLHTKTGRPRTIAWRTPGGDAGPVLLGAPVLDDCPWVFPLEDGTEPYRNFSSNFGRVIRAVVADCAEKQIPFTRFRVHHLRHWYAVRALQNGMPIYELQQQLGHRSLTTTEIYLDYLTPEEQARAKRGVAQTGTHIAGVGALDSSFI